MAKLLETAIKNQNWELAAHALVLAVVQTQINEAKKRNNAGRKNRSRRQPERL